MQATYQLIIEPFDTNFLNYVHSNDALYFHRKIEFSELNGVFKL